MVIKGYRVGPLAKRVGKEILDDNVLGIAAGAAYNFFFSLFPLFLFAAPILSLVGDKQAVLNWLLGYFAQTVPPEAFAPIRAVVQDVVFAPNAPGLMSVGAVLTAWSASNIFGSLMGALNTVYDVPSDSRPWWKQKLIQIWMVLVVGLLMAFAAIVMLAGPNVVDAAGKLFHLPSAAKWIWLVLQYPLAFAFLVGAMWLMYFVLPDYPQHKTQILIGATLASVLWILATIVYRFYVIHFNSMNKAYGTIGAVILLLGWMYYSMVVILAGGELNAELAKGTGALEPRRGAVYDGRIVTASQPDRTSTERIERVAPMSARMPE